MAKRTKKNSKSARSLLKLEALEQRQLLAGGFTDAQGQQWQDIVHSNGNVYDQVLLKSSSIVVNADPGQITRVSFLDQQGDIVQAEFAGSGTLTISLDPDTFQAGVDPVNYKQSDIKYVQGVATFTIQGSGADTNFSVFSVGKGNAANPNLFDLTHTGGNNTADVAKLTIVANPANPNGSIFGGIRAGNAVFSADSGVVGIAAANVAVQDVVRIGDIDAKGSATPYLVFGTNSQFGSVDVAGGDLIQTNGKSINNNGSYDFDLTLVAGSNSAGTALPAANTYTQLTFTDKNPVETQTAKTFSLTTVTDAGSAFVGTPGDDTYVAAIGEDGLPSQGTTLNPGDVLNGGGGSDTLSLSISGANTANQTTASFTASNIEHLSIANFESTAGFGTTIDLAGAAQVTDVTITSSAGTGDTELSSVQTIVGATMKNGTGDLTLTYADAAVSGSSDVQALTLAGQTGGTFTAAKIETLNITSGTVANTITLGAGNDKLKTVNVSGDKDLKLDGNLSGEVTKVDASALTGKLTVTGNTAKDYNFIGGSANDTFAITTGFTNADTVNGGEGSDTLSVNVAVTEDTVKNLTSIETLKLTGATSSSFNKDVVPTTFDLSDANDQSVEFKTSLTTAYAQATTVILTGDNTANGDTIKNSANVELTIKANTDDIAATTSIEGGSGTDTIQLVAKNAVDANFTKVSKVETVTITGSANAGLTFGGVDTVVAEGKTLTIDASAATGNLTINATGEADGKVSITTGSGKDTITGGASGSDTLVSGAGDDSIVIGEVKATNVITAGDGTDTLTVTTDIADAGKLAGVTGVEKLILGASTDITLAAPITATTGIATIDMSNASANQVTLNSGYTGALTLVLSGDNGNIANKIENKANVDLTINANVDDIDGNTSIIGGSGSDVLNLMAKNGTDKTATLTNVSGVESIVVGQNNDSVDDDAIINFGSDNVVGTGKTMTINASALTNSGATLNVDASAETNGFLNITGGAGNDTIIGGGSGFDTLTAGGGNDTLTLGTLQATNVVAGGAGSDMLVVGANIGSSTAFNGVTGIETLQLAGGADLTVTANIKTATGIATIDAGADAGNNAITLSAGVTDSFTVLLTGDAASGDSITNSSDQALTVKAGLADIAAGTVITGGKGTDVIELTGTANLQTADLSGVTNVESVIVKKGGAGFTGTVDVGAATVVAAGKSMTIDASANNAAMTLDASDLNATSGSVVLIGGSGNDTLIGGAQADTFTGGNGNDVFTMSTHANKLTFDTITAVADNDEIHGNTAVGEGEAFTSAKINLGSLATFSDYLDAAAAAGDGASFQWFTFQGNTYIVQDVDGNTTFDAGTDRVIAIQGEKDLSAMNAASATQGVLVINV